MDIDSWGSKKEWTGTEVAQNEPLIQVCPRKHNRMNAVEIFKRGRDGEHEVELVDSNCKRMIVKK